MAYNPKYNEELMGVIPVNDYNEVRVTKLSDDEGKVVSVDFRQWFHQKNDLEMKPTQKGFRIGVDKLDELERLICVIKEG